jgi:hypothetical protein
MIPLEVFEVITKLLLAIVVWVSLTWYGLYKFIGEWSLKNLVFLFNGFILFCYTAYMINGRTYHSEYGGALVWEFYLLIVPLFHTVILGLISLILRIRLKRS